MACCGKPENAGGENVTVDKNKALPTFLLAGWQEGILIYDSVVMLSDGTNTIFFYPRRTET